MKTTLETVELYIIDLRDKAALIANTAPEEKERFVGRQMILLCEKALIAIAAPSNVPDEPQARSLPKNSNS